MIFQLKVYYYNIINMILGLANNEFIAFIEGFIIAFSLIISVGPQNTFLIKQGIRREYVFIIALLCSCIEFFLIILGVFGIKTIISVFNISIKAMMFMGAAFLFLYGSLSFISAFRKGKKAVQGPKVQTNLKKIILTTLFLSSLNPAIIIETLLIIGSMGSKFLGVGKYCFILGATTASIVWFFGIAYISYLGARLFNKAIAWRILDFVTGCIMYMIAVKIILGIYKQ